MHDGAKAQHRGLVHDKTGPQEEFPSRELCPYGPELCSGPGLQKMPFRIYHHHDIACFKNISRKDYISEIYLDLTVIYRLLASLYHCEKTATL